MYPPELFLGSTILNIIHENINHSRPSIILCTNIDFINKAVKYPVIIEKNIRKTAITSFVI